MIANDHADQFFLDCVPSFTIHHGKHGKGSFAGRDYEFDISSELATSLVRYAQDEGYDPAFTSSARLDYAFGIPLTFLQIDGPIIPIFVNAYVPPQLERQKFVDEPESYANGQDINKRQRALLAELNQAELVKLGVHPFLPFMVRLQLYRDGVVLK